MSGGLHWVAEYDILLSTFYWCYYEKATRLIKVSLGNRSRGSLEKEFPSSAIYMRLLIRN